MATQRITNFITLVLDHTPTLDTNAYAQHDILFDFESVALSAGASAARPVRGTINNFTLLARTTTADRSRCSSATPRRPHWAPSTRG